MRKINFEEYNKKRKEKMIEKVGKHQYRFK